MATDRAQIDSIYFEALDRVRHQINHSRKLNPAHAAVATIATLSPTAKPCIHRVQLATIIDEGVVFFAYEGNEPHRNIIRNPELAMCISQSATGMDIIIEGTTRNLTQSESAVIWYRQAQPSNHSIRPKEHQALLLSPERILFCSHQNCPTSQVESYVLGLDDLWHKECQAAGLTRVA